MLSIPALAGLAIMIASGVVAAPWDPVSRHTTHRARTVGPSKVKLTSYHPPTTFESYGVEGVESPLSRRGITDLSPADTAKSFLEGKLGIKADNLTRRSGYSSDIASFEYFSQTINAIPVANAVANVAIKNDKVVSFGASFVKPKSVASAQPKLTSEAAIAKAEQVTGGKYNNWPITLEYFAKDTDNVVLTHVVQVQNEKSSEWYEVYVDANTGDIVNVVDFVADASYRVVPFSSQDPTKGDYGIQSDPADPVVSPSGWHQESLGITTKYTGGNSVIAYKGQAPILSMGATPQSSETNNYDYAYNSEVEPDTSPNVDAARVNAFYVGNMLHDLTYRYGFTEAAYNFQNDNHGKEGKGNDRVQISVQDATGTNNANFATPPDGAPGQMRMFTWTYTTPNRDGALENDIVAHEYGHGVSNRLTGGGTGRCLQTTEAGGMGEGWSDTLASMTEIKKAPLQDVTLGSFVTNITGGIRSYPYSTDKTTNPLTYSSLATKTEVHDIGEVWAEMWHEIIASLMDEHGFAENIFDAAGTQGNVVALHLFMDAFSLQPCNPTFLDARNAIIQADANRYGGANKCLLWITFAKRGLGTGATTAKIDNTSIPAGC